MERQFVWGLRYVDDLILRETFDTTSGSMLTRIYACQDANYNVVALTDASGAVIQRFKYDAYGNSTALDDEFAPDTNNEWETRYAGYRWDTETGLYQVRNRYLHAPLGRWCLRDPIGDLLNEVNFYQYTAGSPINTQDPFGLFPASCYKPCMKCGPEVGTALELTLLNIRSQLDNISWITRYIARRRLALLQGASHWDIKGLVDLEWGGPCYAQRAGTVCETCVQVYGVKQDLYEVNYALWGLMMAAIDIPLQKAHEIAARWKIFKWAVFGEDNKCRPQFQLNRTVLDWVTAGYMMYEPWFWQNASGVFNSYRPVFDNNRFSQCGMCGQDLSGPLSYILLDDLEGSNGSSRR